MAPKSMICSAPTTDDIQIAAQKVHENERADNTDRNCSRHNNGGNNTSKENQQNDDRQGSAEHNILANQRNCSPDIRPLIVHPVQINVQGRQFFRIQPIDHFPEPVRKLQNIGIGLGVDADGDTFFSNVQHGTGKFLIAEAHLGQICHSDAWAD